MTNQALKNETPTAPKAKSPPKQMEPTARPWEVSSSVIVVSNHGDDLKIICNTTSFDALGDQAPDLLTAIANAELICRCVNNHEALLEALRELLAGHDDYPAVKNLPELPRWTLARNVLAAAEKE